MRVRPVTAARRRLLSERNSEKMREEGAFVGAQWNCPFIIHDGGECVNARECPCSVVLSEKRRASDRCVERLGAALACPLILGLVGNAVNDESLLAKLGDGLAIERN